MVNTADISREGEGQGGGGEQRGKPDFELLSLSGHI